MLGEDELRVTIGALPTLCIAPDKCGTGGCRKHPISHPKGAVEGGPKGSGVIGGAGDEEGLDGTGTVVGVTWTPAMQSG